MAEGGAEGASARGQRRGTIADGEIAPKRGETAGRTDGFRSRSCAGNGGREDSDRLRADRCGQTGERRDKRGRDASAGDALQGAEVNELEPGATPEWSVDDECDDVVTPMAYTACVTADAMSGRLTADEAATLLRAQAARLERDSRPLAEALAGIREENRRRSEETK